MTRNGLSLSGITNPWKRLMTGTTVTCLICWTPSFTRVLMETTSAWCLKFWVWTCLRSWKGTTIKDCRWIWSRRSPDRFWWGLTFWTGSVVSFIQIWNPRMSYFAWPLKKSEKSLRMANFQTSSFTAIDCASTARSTTSGLTMSQPSKKSKSQTRSSTSKSRWKSRNSKKSSKTRLLTRTRERTWEERSRSGRRRARSKLRKRTKRPSFKRRRRKPRRPKNCLMRLIQSWC